MAASKPTSFQYFCGSSRFRPYDLSVNSALLYQLSYTPIVVYMWSRKVTLLLPEIKSFVHHFNASRSFHCGEEWIWTTDTVLSLDFEVTFDLTTVRRILTKAIFFYVLYQLSYLPKLFVAHRRIELLFQEWKSYVLTDRRMRHFNCSPTGTRTLDPLIKSQLLYQLSYEGM